MAETLAPGHNFKFSENTLARIWRPFTQGEQNEVLPRISVLRDTGEFAGDRLRRLVWEAGELAVDSDIFRAFFPPLSNASFVNVLLAPLATTSIERFKTKIDKMCRDQDVDENYPSSGAMLNE